MPKLQIGTHGQNSGGWRQWLMRRALAALVHRQVGRAFPSFPVTQSGSFMKKPNTEVLVTYDSKLGSTAEVANFMGNVLTEQGASIAVKPISEVDDLDSYDGVIIGSAIRYDRWSPEARTFVRENKTILSGVPVSFYFTCLTLAKPTPAARLRAEGYADKLRSLVPEVKPVTVGGFAGVLQFARTPWPARLALKVLSIASGVKEGDYRDWEAIRSSPLSQLEPDGLSRKKDAA